MAPTSRPSGPSWRVLIGAAGAVAVVGPLAVVVLVGWIASLTLALAAGLSVSLVLTLALLAGGWQLLRRVEDLTSRTLLEDRILSAPRSGAERGEPEKHGALSQPPEPRTQHPEPARVLLVEDDPVTQRIVARLLRQLGVQTDSVGDGQAALDAVAVRVYALVLMDCQLPVLDGYAAAAEIRRRERLAGSARRLPIIALSASALDGDRKRALAAGMDEHLTKPLDGERLAALLARWGMRPSPGQESRRLLPLEVEAGRPPILDPAGLPTVNGRLSEPYREIVQLYRQEAARRIASLKAAAHTAEWPQVARIAHTLAGSSSSIGALRMAAACAALETLAQEQENAPAHPVASDGAAAGHAYAGHAHGDDALAGAVEGVRRELEQLDAALAHLTGERPPV